MTRPPQCRRPRRAIPGVLFLLCVLPMAARPARATMGPPVTVNLVGGDRPAEAGQVFTASARFTAARSLELSDVAIVPDPAWQIVSVDDPGLVLIQADQYVDLAFSVLAVDPDAAPLTFRFRCDGAEGTGNLCLSPLAFAEGATDQSMGTITPDGDGGPAQAVSLPRPEPASAVEATAAAVDKVGRPLTVHGRFLYMRPGSLKTDGADGVTVEVYADELLRATTTTDAAGSFNASFVWSPPTAAHDLDPDLQVKFVTDSSKVRTLNSAGKTMRWASGVWPDFAGSSLDVGWLTPKAYAQNVYLTAHTALTRTWRWLLAETGVDWLKVSLRQEPKDANAAWYDWHQKTIHIGTSRMYTEITVAHEAGHHFLEWHGSGVQGHNAYCNGICDEIHDDNHNGILDCGHCTWCREEAEDAWNEGFPTWIGTQLGRAMTVQYGVSPYGMLQFESLEECRNAGPYALHDPWRNEGPFVALLWDIVDADNEDDTLTPETAGWRDQLTLGTNAIWDVLWGDAPRTPSDFLTGFLGNNGSLREDIWETARNNGYEIDAQAPPLPFIFSSTSHLPGTPSTDQTVDLYWLAAPDDASGVAGYSLRANLGGPAAPSEILSCGNVGTFTTLNLPPGSWWFTIKALDRAGHWSAGYSTYGPIVVAAPATVDLESVTPAGWSLPLVPQSVQVGGGTVPSPTLLTGGGATWWNLGVRNAGTTAATGNVHLRLRVDGQTREEVVIPAATPLAGGATRTWVNQGPVSVLGGRHAFGAWLDSGESLAETEETDNYWAWQWLWAPSELSVAPTQTLAVPPSPTGGWENLAGGATGYNVDAYRVRVPAGTVHGVCLFAADDAADYDLQLHTASNDPLAGLNTWLASSARLAGQLDGVIIAAGAGEVLDDAAVLNYSGGAAYARLAHVAAGSYALYDMPSLDFAADEMLKIGVVRILGGEEGPLTLRLDSDPTEGPLSLVWLGAFTGARSLDSWQAYSRTGADGVARLDVSVAAPGSYVFALYRHPATGRQSRQVGLRLAPTQADLQPVAAPGWFAPLVPRALPDGSAASVPEPFELFAAPAATYFNVAVGNDGTATFAPPVCAVRVDGVDVLTLTLPTLGDGQQALVNVATPVLVPGGRHTAQLVVDPDNFQPEENDADNNHARQWVWAPPYLAAGAVSAVHPPNPNAGWEDLVQPDAIGLAANCAGIRVGGAPDGRTRAGMWTGLLLMPAAGEDVDVALHEISIGAQDGFLDPLAFSGWPAGESDFVVANYDRTAPRAFDAGLRRFSGAGPVQVASVASTFLGEDPAGPSTVFSLPAVQGLALHEVRLSPGVWRVHLQNVAGTVDYGLSAHSGDLPFAAKSTTFERAASWTAGPGADEEVVLTVDQSRYFCLAVWKRGAGDWPLAGSYRLVFSAGVSGVADLTVAGVTCLEGAQPNPFNPRVTISYQVATAGPVELWVYDLRGRRVRRLVSAAEAVGSRQVVWDGVDDAGQPAASGTYVLRLVGPDGPAPARRVTLLK